MKVPNGEDVASHTVPESCMAYREVRREALTGVRVGQPLSREIVINQGADAVIEAEGNMGRGDSASTCSALRGLRPWHARMLLVREPGDLLLGHSSQVARIGKVKSRSR